MRTSLVILLSREKVSLKENPYSTQCGLLHLEGQGTPETTRLLDDAISCHVS